MWDKQNGPIKRTALGLFSTTTCDIPSGEAGMWNSSGTLMFRNSDGTDSVIKTESGAPFFVAITKTAGALAGSPDYDNGTSGVGATLTKHTAGAIGTIGGVALTSANVGQVILVDQQASTFQNGLYVLTDAGGATKWKLTRLVGFDTAATIVDGAQVAVQQGTFADQIYDQSATVVTVGSDAITFALSATAVTFAAVNTALGNASAAIGVNGQKITSLSNPSAANDAANKSYVDSHAFTVQGSGTVTVGSGTVQFANSNNVTFGLSSNGVMTASVASLGVADSAGTVTNGNVVFSNSNGLSFGLNGSTLTAKLPSVKYWENDLAPNNALFVQTGSGAINLSLQRVSFPYQISATQLDVLGALTVVGNTNFSYSISAGIYSFNSNSLSLASSSVQQISVNSTALTNYSGTRFRSVPLGTWNITPGEYVLGLMVSGNGPAGTTGSFSFFGQNSVSINGVEGNAANYTAYFQPGIYSAATGAFPSTITLGNINVSGSASTNNALAQPYVRLIASNA